MRRVYFLAIVLGVLALALACSEREEYKGSGSRSLVDPTFDGSAVSTSGGIGGDAAVPSDGASSDSAVLPDTFVIDTGFDAKTDG